MTVVPCTATSQIRAHRVRGSHTLSRVFVAYFFRHRHHRRIRCLCSLHLLVHTECSKRLSDGNQCEGRGSIRKINATTKPKTLRPKLTRQPQCTRWLLVHICVGAGSRRGKSKQRCGAGSGLWQGMAMGPWVVAHHDGRGAAIHERDQNNG